MHWTFEMRLWQTWENILEGNPMFPFNDRRLSFKKFCFQKNFCKWSSAQVGYGFENHALLFCWKYKFFSSKSKIDSKNIYSRLTPQIFFLRKLIGDLTHLTKKLWKKTKESFKLQKWQKKKKLFRKRNPFSSKYCSGSANFCWLNPEKNFLTERPIFFISKSEEGRNHVQFSEKKVFPQNL